MEKVSHLSQPTQLNTHERSLGIIKDVPLTESSSPRLAQKKHKCTHMTFKVDLKLKKKKLSALNLFGQKKLFCEIEEFFFLISHQPFPTQYFNDHDNTLMETRLMAQHWLRLRDMNRESVLLLASYINELPFRE